MINKAIIMGRVGKNPEIKNESKIANFTIATSEKWKDKNGEVKENTQWHRVVIFNEKLISNVVAKYIKQGSLIYIEGKLQTRSYEKAGKTLYTTEIVLTAFDGVLKLIPTGQKQETQNTTEQEVDEEVPEDEIPF